MAEKHTRAVQRLRRKFTDPLDYEVLCVIALDIGRDGSPAKTSYRGMADRTSCHYNTVAAHVSKLEAGGWVSVDRSGKYNLYRLLIDCGNESEIVTTGYDNQQKIVTSDYDNYQELSQRLSQLEETLSQRLSQIEASIVTTGQTETVTEDSEDKRRKKGKKELYIEHTPDPVNEMINAISKASGVTCAVGVNDSEFRESAYALIGNDIAPGDLPLFCAWWGANGHYKGKPAIKSILTKIRAAKDSDWQDLPTPTANGNGSHQPTERKLSNAEAGAVEYAAMRATLVRKP